MRGGRYLVVLAGAGVLAAGCGTKAAPGVGLAAAVTRTAGQSARVAVTTTMQTPGMSVSFTETGAFDFGPSRGMGSGQCPVGITEIFIPPKAYIKIPGGVSGPLPRGKSWIAVDAGASGGRVSSLLGPFGGGGTDPADLLASLTAISSGVTQLGSTTIRGVPVSGFRVDIDPAKAAARVPRWERPGVVGFARTLGSGAIPVDGWGVGQNLSGGAPKITVASFRVVSAQPAGNGRATVRFTVQARASLGGQDVPVFPQGPRRVQWLVTTETAGHWYVDLARSSAFVFSGACP